MEPLEFLAAVLPSPGRGYYCTAELSSKKKEHVFVERIEEIAPHAQRWLSVKRDVYFALATFEDNKSRTADNAQYMRSLFIDMDGYESIEAARSALTEFLDATSIGSLGAPWLVNSGGGLHCYWALDDDVSVLQWKPVAENLKKACKKFDLTIDNTVTADAARVLRIPGTTNFKPKYPEPRPVELLERGQTVAFSAFAAKLRDLVGGNASDEAPLMLPGKRPTGASKTTVQLIANTVSRFKTIVERTKKGTGCLQLQHYVENAASEGMEPLWRAWLSQAKYCTDSERAVIWLSKLHPYDEDRMRTKVNEIKGPYNCLKFDSENPGICTGCQHFGTITNPLALGREIVADNSVKEIEIPSSDADDPDAPAIKVYRPSPPKGYSYGQNGGIFCEKIIEEADGTKRKQQVMILPYDLFVVDLLNKDGEHTVHMVANRPGKPVDVLMPQRYAVSKDELLKTLAQQNIIASFGSGNDKNLFEYVRACVEDASVNKESIRVPTQYGWQEDNSFVYSGKVYRSDGSTRTVPMPDLQNITRATRQQGTLEEWRKFPQLLIQRGMFDLLAISAIAFGAPMMRFTQMSALTFHAGSTDSGTGKSLALSLINSVWGHPIRYRTGKSTSPVTMQQRMGNLNSLPFTSDEITHKSRQDMEWFPGFVFDASEGQGKEKSEVHNNRERLNLVSWATLLYLTSNTNMHDFMSGVRSHTSQGELMRMLEWNPTRKLNWTPQEEDVLKLLMTNHGVAGDKYARWLVQNTALCETLTQQATQMLKREWNMSGDERYWAAGCGAIVAGVIAASSKYADVIDYPLDKIIAELKALVDKARTVVRVGARSAEDVFNSFIREYYGQFVVMRRSNGGLLAELGNGEPIDQTITRSKVMGRVEHSLQQANTIEFFIEEQVMKAHCVSMSFGYSEFKKQLENIDTLRVRYMRKDMMASTKGPQMRVNAISFIRRDEDVEALALGPR